MAITIQPTMAANNSMLTTSKGSIKPYCVVLNICSPMAATGTVNGFGDAGIKLCAAMIRYEKAKPNTTASPANSIRVSGGLGILPPDFCVRKIEKMISTTMPPTYTMICTAAINSTFSQQYKDATPTSKNSNN